MSSRQYNNKQQQQQQGQSKFKNAQGPPQQQKQIKIDPNDQELLSISRWNKLRSDLKIKPASSLRITNPNKDSECYKLTPRGLEGINYQPKSRETKRLAIKFNFTFYSNQIKEFFGRSVLTGAYYLRSEQQGYNFQFEDPHPFSLFFHTQLEKSSATLIIFEAYILEIGNYDVIYNTFSCGVGEVNINNAIRDPQSVTLKNTTMRGYVSNQTTDQNQKQNSSGVRFLFYLDYFPLLQRIKHLFPESVLISTNDLIPGLVEEWVDTKFQENEQIKMEQVYDIMMTPLPTYKLYLTNVQILFKDSIEKELIRQVQQFLEVSKSINNRVIFKEKKLICGFHNGWEFVNRGGSQNRVTLKQGSRDSARNQEGQDLSLISLEYSGMHEIDNVFESNQSCIVLQLEYDIEYVAQARQIASRVIGWLPISISGKLAGHKELTIQDTMLHGPGKSVDGQRMISLPMKDDFDISISVGFRTVQQGANQQNLYDEIQKTIKLQSEYREQQQPQQFQQQQRQMDQNRSQMMPNRQFQPGMGPAPGQRQAGADVQISMLDQQLYNERKKLEDINEQIMLRRQQQQQQQAQPGQLYSTQDYQMITWEPRNEQERYLRQLQQQEQMMRNQIEQSVRERDQVQIGLTQEYKMMREELVKTRQSQTASSQGFFKKPSNQKALQPKASPQKQRSGYNYQNDDDEGEDVEYLEERQLDFNPVKSRITYQGNDQDEQLVVHLNQPTYGKRSLSQQDKLYLINQGVFGLLDDIPVMNTKEQVTDEKVLIEEDMKDPLKASTVIFKLLSFKPSTFSGLPRRMYLTFNFFDFPKFQTESFSYESQDDQNIIVSMIDTKTPILIYREAFFKGEENKFMSFKFEIDPSKSKYHDLFKDFIKYLLKKQLHIDIWDADTLMLFGSFKVPLNKIRRAGLNKKSTQLDLDIVNQNFQGPRGSIQIQVENIGKEESNPSRRKEQEQENKNNNSSINQWQNKAINKAKIISDSSIQIPMNYIKNQKANDAFQPNKDDKNKANAGIKADEQQRKVERVKRFKNNTLNQAALLFEGDEQSIMNKVSFGFDISKIKDLSQYRIDQIDDIKNRKKPEFVKNVISKFLNEEKVLSVSYGKQEIVPYLLQNPTQTIQTFSIVIEDGDIDILPYNEFEPVSDPTEWKYWTNALGLPEIPAYDILSGNTIVLEPSQKVHVIFKYMTYRNIDPQIKDKHDAEKIASQREDAYRQKYINPRSINIFFSLKNQTIIGGFRLKVEPHQQIIDHIFRYYERAGKSVNITLPPLYLKDQSPLLRPTLHVTDGSVHLEWVNEQEIAFSTKMPNISRVMKFNILVYNSDLRSNLLANVQIELHSLEGVDVHVNMGQTTSFKLHVPGDIPRVVQLYSSQTDVVWFNSPYDQTFTLPPGKITQIETSVKSLKTGQQRIQINAVDVHANQLVHSWIVRIETDIPKPNKTYEINTVAYKESVQVFEYINKSFKTKNFTFLCSDPSILEIMNPTKQIIGNSGEEIAIKVVARDYTTPECSVIVFVSDFDETVFDTLKFRIKYLYNEEAQGLQTFNKLKQQKDMILQSQAMQSMNEQDQRQQQLGYQSGTNFYNTGDQFYQSNSNWQNESRYGNQGFNQNDNRYGQGNYQNDNQYGGQGGYYNDGGRQQNNYNDYNNQQNNNNYGDYDNKNRKRTNQSQDGYNNQNNYQDYGRNQPPPSRGGGGGNYNDYNKQQGNYNDYGKQQGNYNDYGNKQQGNYNDYGKQQGNYNDYQNQQQQQNNNRNSKKVKFDTDNGYGQYGRNNYNQY